MPNEFVRFLTLRQPVGRAWYTVACVLFIDIDLQFRLRADLLSRHGATNLGVLFDALFFLLLMFWLSAARFIDLGLRKLWALPYSVITLAPFAMLYLAPSLNPWIATAGAIILQTPAMLANSKERKSPAAGPT
jgi:hypothetical protein